MPSSTSLRAIASGSQISEHTLSLDNVAASAHRSGSSLTFTSSTSAGLTSMMRVGSSASSTQPASTTITASALSTTVQDQGYERAIGGASTGVGGVPTRMTSAGFDGNPCR